MTLRVATQAIHNFLVANHVDPKKVAVVFRCADDETLAQLEASILQWITPEVCGSIEGAYSTTPQISARRFTINGVQVRLSTFDVAPSPGSQS